MAVTILENLPNVAIRNIIIENSQESESKFVIQAEVVVFGLDSTQPSKRWTEDDFLLKHLNLVVVASSNSAFNRDVSSGLITIGTQNINSYSSTQNDIQLKQISLKQKIKLLREETDSGQYSCVATVIFDQKIETDSVYLFAMTSINMKSLSSYYGVDLKSEQVSNYMGPIVSEPIIKDGSLVTESNVLRLQNGELYNGPYHAHEAGYMVGSFHSSDPHPSLNVSIVPNTKLKDNRFKKYPDYNTNQVQDLKNISSFSMLYASQNNPNELTCMFSINVHNILLTRTKYGRLLYNLKPEVYESMLSNFMIKNLKIYKRKVKQQKHSKKIVKYLSRDLIIDSKDFANENNLAPKTKLIREGSRATVAEPNVQEIVESPDIFSFNNDFFNDNQGVTRSLTDYRFFSRIKEEAAMTQAQSTKYIRTFSFADFSPQTKFSEKCVFEIDMTFNDPSISALQNIMVEIKNSISELDRYINMSLKKRNYDFKLKKLKQEYLNSLSGRYSSPDNYPWIKSVSTYAKYFSLMKDITPLEQERKALNYYGFLNPQSFQPKSAKMFLYEFKQLSCRMMKYFKVSYNMLDNKVIQKSQKIYQNVNHSDIDVNHEFSNVLDYKQGKDGFKFFTANETTEPQTYIFRSMSKNSFINRMAAEVQKLKNESSYEDILPYISPNLFSWGNKDWALRDENLTYSDLIPNILTDGVVDEETSFAPDNWQQVPNTDFEQNAGVLFQFSDDDYRLASDYIGSRYGVLGSEDIEEEYLPNSYQRSSPNGQGPLGSVFAEDSSTLFDDLNASLANATEDDNGTPLRYYKDFLDSANKMSTPIDFDSAVLMLKSIQKIQYKPSYSATLQSMGKENWIDLTSDLLNSLQGDILCRMVPANIANRMLPTKYRI